MIREYIPTDPFTFPPFVHIFFWGKAKWLVNQHLLVLHGHSELWAGCNLQNTGSGKHEGLVTWDTWVTKAMLVAIHSILFGQNHDYIYI